MRKEYAIPFNEAKKKLLEKQLYKYNNCSTACDSCEALDNCSDAFEANYRIAALSIEERKIIPTSKKTQTISPKRRKFDIPRVPTSYLGGENC